MAQLKNGTRIYGNATVDNNLTVTSGNIGVGTTSAQTRIHAYVSTSDTGAGRTTPLDVLTIESENTGAVEFNGFGQGLVFRGSTYNNATQRTLGRILHQINDDSINTTRGTSIAFQTSDNAGTTSAPTTKLLIDWAGNIGIGQLTPAAKLDVFGSAKFGGSVSAGRVVNITNEGAVTLAFGNNANQSNLILQNAFDTTSTVNHGNSILWQFGTNTTTTPINAGRINILKEQQWTTTATTQDSYFTIDLTVDAVLTERFRISSAGDTTVAGDLVVSGGDINTAAATNSTLFSTTTTGTIAIGGALTTGTLTLGSANGSGTISIGNTGTAAAQTVNISTATTGTITIGGTGATAVQLPTGKTKVGQTFLLQGVAGNITLPSTAGTLVGSGDTSTVTNTMLAGSIAPGKLTLTSAQIIVGNASNVGAAVSMSGDATISNAGAVTIANNAVTFAKFQQSVAAGLSVIGRNTNSAGNFAEIAAGTDGHVLYRASSTSLTFGQLPTASISDSAITFAKIQNSAAAGLSVIGRNVNSAGAFAEIAAGTDGHVLYRASSTSLTFGQLPTASISDSAITFAKIQNSAAAGLSVIGRSANTAGAFAEIAAVTDGHVLRLSGTTLGFGTIATAGITDSAVTFAKIQNSAAAGLSVIGRSTNTAGVFAEISAANDGEVLRRSGTAVGFGTIATAGIANNAVTFAKIQQSAAAGLSVIGRSANTAGDFAEINAGTDGHVLRRSGTAVGFGEIATAGIANSAVTYAKIQNVSATDRLLGRSTAGAGVIEEITCTASGRSLISLNATQGGILYGSSTSAAAYNTAGTSGQLLISKGTAAPAFETFEFSLHAPHASYKSICRVATTADLEASTFAADVLTGYDDTFVLACTTTAGSATVTTTSTAGIKVGATIAINAIFPTAKTVASIVDATTFTITSGTDVVAGTAVNSTFTQTIAALTIDGVALAVNDRVLVKDQVTLGGLVVADAAKYNGIYRVTATGSTTVPWTLTRTDDANVATDLDGAIVNISVGTNNFGKSYKTRFRGTDTLNTTEMYWGRIVDVNSSALYQLPTTATAIDISTDTETLRLKTGNITDLVTGLSIGVKTISPLAASTYTTASSLYIAGAPAAGTNATITTAFALNVAAGNSNFGGNITSSGSLTIGTIDSSGTAALNIGTGANAKTITLGNATGATSVVINCGTGALNIGTNAIARTLTIGNGTGASSVVINAGTGALDVGANAIARTVTVGNTTGASVLNLRAGTGGVSILTGTTGAVSIDSGTTGAINIGTNANAKTVTIGNVTGASGTVINVGTAGAKVGYAAGGSGLVQAPFWVRINTARTKATNNTTLEAVFDAANDTIDLIANTLYYFKGTYVMSTSATGSSAGLQTGFIFSQVQQEIAYTATAYTQTVSTVNLSQYITTTAATTVTSIGTAATNYIIIIEGYFKSNATTGGTLIPAFAQSVAGTTVAPTASANTWFTCQPVGAVTATILSGTWT